MFSSRSKVLFVFSDPGGAKPCLALIAKHAELEVFAVSDRKYDFYEDFGIEVLQVQRGDEEKIIENCKPTFIFTGTSYKSDIELRFLKIAKERGINSCSFVDHWTSISQRFCDEENSLVLPDEIWVLDERAKQMAINEGIPRDLLRIAENPYHKWLEQWRPNIDRSIFLSKLGLDLDKKKVIVFVPDPLSNINGEQIYGFDELSSLIELQLVFQTHADELEDWVVLVKPHPNQNIDLMRSVIDNNSFRILSESSNINEIMFYGDVIFGFFSSALIEAAIMQKPVFRLLPQDMNNDPFQGLNIGEIISIENIVNNLLFLNYGDEK